MESLGVTVEVQSQDPWLIDALPGVLPLWRPVGQGTDPSVSYQVTRGGDILTDGRLVKRSSSEQLGQVFAAGSVIREYLATRAPEHFFFHAGVVAVEGIALVAPGRTFSGKTTLISELVRAGADYYSDEYAVVDREGAIHAYPRMLTLRRDPRTGRQRVLVRRHDSDYQPGPASAGLVVVTSFTPGAEWSPVPMTTAEAVLELFANAVGARARPVEVLAAARRVSEGAVRWRGARGEAQALAPELLEVIASNTRPGVVVSEARNDRDFC
jgi:hypothetical protein